MRGKKSSTKSTKIIPKIVSIFNPPQSAFLKSSIARIIRFCKFFEKCLDNQNVSDIFEGEQTQDCRRCISRQSALEKKRC